MSTALFSSATIAEVYRFALLLTGDLKTAGEIVAECLHDAQAQLAEIRSDINRQAALIQGVRERCQGIEFSGGPAVPRLVRMPPEGGGTPEILEIEAFIVAQRFSTLPEPARSALALFYLEFFGPEEIARVLKMSPEELGVALGEGRELLVEAMEGGGGMTIGETNPLLHCYRGDAARDAWLGKAVRKVEGDAALEALLREQVAFDRQFVEAIHAVRPPDDLRSRLGELTAKTAARRRIRRYLCNPAALSAGFGVILIIGVMIFLQIERMNDFPGKEIAGRLLSVTGRLDGSDFQATDLPAGQLGDAMYIGGFEGYALPPPLAEMPALGWRVGKLFGRRVAQVAIAEHGAVLVLFRATDFGVQVPDPAVWHIIREDGWVGAVRETEGLCCMIAFHGSKPEMENFLRNINP